MPQRLPRFYAYLQKIEDEKRLAKIILETGGVEVEGPRLANSADGHHWQRLARVADGLEGRVGGDPGERSAASAARKGERATAVAEPLALPLAGGMR